MAERTSEKGKKKLPYEVNSRVLCKHTDSLYYETKIVSVEPIGDDFLYTVHYQGWSKRHDEKILHSATEFRFREFTPANAELAKMEMREAQMREKEKLLLSKSRRRVKSDRRTSTQAPPSSVTSSSTFNDERRERSSSVTKSGCSSLAPSLQGLKIKETEESAGNSDNDYQTSNRSAPSKEKFPFPENLNAIIENDRHIIENDLKLPRLPARTSLSKILNQYSACMRKMNAVCNTNSDRTDTVRTWNLVVSSLDECVSGIEDLFDLVVATELLHNNEKPRHEDMVTNGIMRKYEPLAFLQSDGDGLRPCECYGFVYLLRLLLKFQTLIMYMPCDEDSKDILKAFSRSFLIYLSKNVTTLFNADSDYAPFTVGYQERIAKMQ